MKEISRNFNQFELETIVKVGGSLLRNIPVCYQLASTLSEIGAKRKILLFPGGGEIDNYIEEYNENIELDREIFHCTTMLSLDQMGMLFSNYSDKIVPVKNVGEMEVAWKQNKTPIILPSSIIIALKPFRYTNRVSSDSYSLYFSHIFEAHNVLILKSVDGIVNKHNKTIQSISYDGFIELRHNCVDETFPIYAKYLRKKICIVNGNNIKGIKDFFDESEEINHGTYVY